jgi:hypothetical protein
MRWPLRLRKRPVQAVVLPLGSEPTFLVCCPCCAVHDDRTVTDDSPCGRLCFRCRGLCQAIPFRPTMAAGVPRVARPVEDPLWTRYR